MVGAAPVADWTGGAVGWLVQMEGFKAEFALPPLTEPLTSSPDRPHLGVPAFTCRWTGEFGK